MILKKPYAFLIKHFKLIHAILAALYVYLSFHVSGILNFYNNFIDGTVGKLNAINYITNIPYIVIIISIIMCIILFVLMHYKKKPKFLYITLILIYLIVFALIFITSNGLNTIYNNILDTKTTLLYRDFLRIIIIFQYGTVLLTTIRAIGFDIKKFNFSEDLHELNIDVTDDEEVELVMGINSHRMTQKINRRIRELKYYYHENKIFVLTLLGVLLLFALSTITIDKTVVNKVYKETEIFKSDNFQMKIVDSYITNKKYNGEEISENSNFIIIKLNINPIQNSQSLNINNLVLKINKNKYQPTKKYYNYFKDLGIGYKSQVIKTGQTYILTYIIPKEELEEQMQIIYTGSTKEIKVNLSPLNLDKNIKNKKLKLTESIDFSNSILSGSEYKIKSYEIKDKFTYNYTYTINNKEYTGKKYITSPSNTILYLELSSSYSINTTNFDFINDYGVIKYTINKEEYTNKKLTDKTPGNLKKGIYLEVDKNLEKAEKIWLEFNIRNITYKYIIK